MNSLAITSALSDDRWPTTLDWMRGDEEYERDATTHVVEYEEHPHAWSSAALRRGDRAALAARAQAQSAADTASAEVPTRQAS